MKSIKIPRLLKDVKPPVKKLYCKGLPNKNLFKKSVAVVGSRRFTSYGKRIVEDFVPVLVDAGVTIVSGFMYGIDQLAHQICLGAGGQTVAVLGWGINWEVGEEDKKLYKKIKRQGLLLSEYPDETKPQLWMFPKRNRIVAGLSHATLIVEAAEDSGSLITANFATKFDRKLFAVPGPITSRASEGTNALIKSGQAQMATSAADILDALGWEHAATSGITPEAGGIGIISLLENEGMTVDEIAKRLSRSVEDVGVELSSFQLQNKIEEMEGKFHLLKGKI
ncbi:DNA protecting protein DprA [Candidatus Woesebacteria bacterium RIFCSPHIGHO2_01_FULL_44_10]|uniref:DNA protecting protein DprA n=1 Tax=Candidatus Woesebacteria bacterium RIFCSPLOWO2_01_FULL_44_14 TaxID=1802525 RepID=A0A1F8C2N0_9BACT|nr:MAG: DNA protecting protein DprA [Candidatus Woesebacteria bacterium RIFCSPHIGHO2_01_FULL_44_10]OGM54571.1 MAG: DNA protecting protein DprA [Candidatus Woesebacteria bacterium RIFCSPHIGHO2_12_FULL_44_11]OGM70594.1 MAG: DNA protecting protein DprA [Candidatus Woesebacteria bacterium RIFCSPLOWO2_01_FULL_44_14]